MKPPILILMTDQQRADCLGCAGHPQLNTPHMDRLASEGIRFTHTMTTTPVCMPARLSFITGLYPHHHGKWKNGGKLPKRIFSLFQALRKQGYYTAHVGKAHYYSHKKDTHLGQSKDGMHQVGLEYVHEITGPRAAVNTDSYMTDEWSRKGILNVFRKDLIYRMKNRWTTRPNPVKMEDHMDSYVGRKAVKFIREYNGKRPLCLFAGFPGPHDPWDAPGKYASMYNPHETPLPVPVPKANSNLPDYVMEKNDFQPIQDITLKDIQHIRANYYGKISLIDYWIGKILQSLEKRGWLEEALILFLSDHGEMLGDHGRLFKETFHESSIRIPLIFRWPGKVPKGVTSHTLVEIIDLFPTLLETVGFDPPGSCDGKSLWPILENPEHEHRRTAFSEIKVQGSKNRMIRTQRYKYAEDGKGRGFMLYDLEGDPMEQNNLIGQKDAVKLMREMKGYLDDRSRT